MAAAREKKRPLVAVAAVVVEATLRMEEPRKKVRKQPLPPPTGYRCRDVVRQQPAWRKWAQNVLLLRRDALERRRRW